MPKNSSSYNAPKVTASSIRQILISNRTLALSQSSSLLGKPRAIISENAYLRRKIRIMLPSVRYKYRRAMRKAIMHGYSTHCFKQALLFTKFYTPCIGYMGDTIDLSSN